MTCKSPEGGSLFRIRVSDFVNALSERDIRRITHRNELFYHKMGRDVRKMKKINNEIDEQLKTVLDQSQSVKSSAILNKGSQNIFQRNEKIYRFHEEDM